MSDLTREVEAATEWLQREAERTPFGTVGVSLTLHRGVVSKIERSTSVSLKPETGDPHAGPR